MPFFMRNADQYWVVDKKYPSDRFIISQKSKVKFIMSRKRPEINAGNPWFLI